MKLSVDCFDIDLETLSDADWNRQNWKMEEARIKVIREVIKNLATGDREKLEKYQEENDR